MNLRTKTGYSRLFVMKHSKWIQTRIVEQRDRRMIGGIITTVLTVYSYKGTKEIGENDDHIKRDSQDKKRMELNVNHSSEDYLITWCQLTHLFSWHLLWHLLRWHLLRWHLRRWHLRLTEFHPLYQKHQNELSTSPSSQGQIYWCEMNWCLDHWSVYNVIMLSQVISYRR